jgi:tRNA(fMet)-specific endonuclease VapC
MPLYIFDTDIAGFIQQEYPSVIQRIQSLSFDDKLATTIITVNEDLSGWQAKCHRARDPLARSWSYQKLQEAFSFYCQKSVLPFDEDAVRIFTQLQSQKIRVGTNDLTIASIALSVEAVLVTRNTVDFQRIPNLHLEDWTIKTS